MKLPPCLHHPQTQYNLGVKSLKNLYFSDSDNLFLHPVHSDTSVTIRDFWTVTFEHTNLRFPA